MSGVGRCQGSGLRRRSTRGLARRASGGRRKRRRSEAYSSQGIEALLVRVLAERVEVGADRARKEDGLLGEESESRAEVVQADLGDVDAIDAAYPESRSSQKPDRVDHGLTPRRARPQRLTGCDQRWVP